MESDMERMQLEVEDEDEDEEDGQDRELACFRDDWIVEDGTGYGERPRKRKRERRAPSPFASRPPSSSKKRLAATQAHPSTQARTTSAPRLSFASARPRSPPLVVAAKNFTPQPRIALYDDEDQEDAGGDNVSEGGAPPLSGDTPAAHVQNASLPFYIEMRASGYVGRLGIQCQPGSTVRKALDKFRELLQEKLHATAVDIDSVLILPMRLNIALDDMAIPNAAYEVTIARALPRVRSSARPALFC